MLRILSLMSVGMAGAALAAPVVDQAHVVTQSTGGRILYAGNSPGQGFTAGTGGLLSQVDVLLRRDAGDIGDLSLELWPFVAEGPAGTAPLFSTPIDTSIISVGSSDYVSVDVSGGGLTMVPGERYAIAISATAGLSDPNASWTSGFPGYEAGDLFDRFGAWEFDGGTRDYGFRTWVDPDATGGLNEVTLPLLADAEARLYPSIGLTEYGGTSIVIDAERSDGSDSRGLFTFDASVLPEGADLQSATFSFQMGSFTSGSAGDPEVEVYGFEGNGLPTAGDASDLSLPLGTTGPVTDLGIQSVSLDPAKIETLVQASSTVGLTAYQAGAPQWLSINSSEQAAQFPSFYKAPTLKVGLAPTPTPARLPDGDYNGDARVDAADYTVWRDNGGSQAEYNDWAANYGTAPSDEVADGGFQAITLEDWTVEIAPNSNVSTTPPGIELFDVDGDGTATIAFRTRLGRFDTSQDGGIVSIEQELLLEGGAYDLAADVATRSLDAFGNTGPGNYLLYFDDEVVDQVILNGTLIEAGAVIRDQLAVTLTDVQPGYHKLRLVVNRGATALANLRHYIDNVSITPVTGLAVPEPGTAALLATALMGTLGRRRG